MKILLTGATGYLGRHLAKRFILDGHDVAILIRRNSNKSSLVGLQKHLKCYVLEEDGLNAPFQEIPDLGAVVHAATLYGRNGESSLDLAEANTFMPLRLLERAHSCGVETFVNTDTFFSSGVNYEYLAGYALSKRHFAEWGRYYAAGNKLRFLNIQLEQMYGPGDSDSKFVNWIVRRCLDGDKVIELTEGMQQRDFIYIEDVVLAYSMLLKRADTLNMGWTPLGLGCAQPVTIKAFVELVLRLSSSKSTLIFGAKPYRFGEIMHSCANIGFLQNIGWTPRFSLECGVKRTIIGDAIGPQIETAPNSPGGSR